MFAAFLFPVNDYLMRAAALANDIKPPLALDRERLAALAFAPRVKLSAMRTNLGFTNYHSTLKIKTPINIAASEPFMTAK